MKKFAPIALATIATLALAACGSTTDASEDAIADTVEMPADEAMADAPEPVDDAAIGEMDALEAAEVAEDIVEADAEEAAAE